MAQVALRVFFDTILALDELASDLSEDVADLTIQTIDVHVELFRWFF